jgi:SAM-dependent methyltransferase
VIGASLVQPLEDDWRETLAAVARSRGWPATGDVAKLAARVAELSAAYNDPARASAAMRDAGAARLGFFFARDVPKGAAAVRELVATGAVGLRPAKPLRILDLGAGLGATTWGLARALGAGGAEGALDATWVDPDGEALALGAAVVRAREGCAGAVRLRVQTRVAPLTAPGPGRFDVVLLGQVLSELDVGADETARRDRHAALVRSLFEERLEAGGALVIVEPALRDRARHLHRVRDALTAGGMTVFAPCLHDGPCPALGEGAPDAPRAGSRDGAREEWCHEDLDVDLPEWLFPVARAAGLRREGLTFSYLVLHAGGRRLANDVRSPGGTVRSAARLRVVSDGIVSKGKREAFVCGELGGEGTARAVRARLMRLDRDARPSNAAWEELRRGEVVWVAPAPDLNRPRIGADGTVIRAVLRADSRDDDAESR